MVKFGPFLRVILSAVFLFAVILTAGAIRFSPTARAQSGAPRVPAGLVETERGARTLDQIAAGFPDPNEAAALLKAWGWQGNAYFNYSGTTAAGTTSLEVSYHLFATTTGAAAAMSYFANGRAVIRGLNPVPIARIGDQVLAISGHPSDGNEVTLYLRRGAFLIRISAVAPTGDPLADATATAQGVVSQMAGAGVHAAASTVDELLPTTAELPAGFVVTENGTRSQQDVADTFLNPTDAARQLAGWGFEQNVYRNFALRSGVAPQLGRASTIEVSLHLFDSNTGAHDALPYYGDGRIAALGLVLIGTYPIGDGAYVLQGPAPSGTGIEVTIYFVLSNVLARVSVVAPAGVPVADALAVAWAVAARA